MQKPDIWTEEAKAWLLGVLKSGKVYIGFTKECTHEREILCSLSKDYIPGYQGAGSSTIDTIQKIVPNSITVYNIENNSWVLISYTSIKSLRFDL